jgi:hypothetical protein
MDIPAQLRLASDSRILTMFEPFILRNDSTVGPWPRMLDSVWQSDSLALASTLAAMITDPLTYGTWVAMAAAEAYRRFGGPADLVLWAMDYPTRDERRSQILAALTETLTSEQQDILLRQACLTGATLEAARGQLAVWRQLHAQVAPPLWYQVGLDDLRRIQSLLTRDRRAAFDRILGPVLRAAAHAGY